MRNASWTGWGLDMGFSELSTDPGFQAARPRRLSNFYSFQSHHWEEWKFIVFIIHQHLWWTTDRPPLKSRPPCQKCSLHISMKNPISRATPFFLTCKEQRYLALAPSCDTSRYYIASQMSGPLTNHLSELLTAVPVRPRFFCCMPPHHHQSMWRQAVHEGGVCPGFTPACQPCQFTCCVFGQLTKG